MGSPAGWFCALLDTAPDVYFRYTISPARRLAYVSPSVHALTGHLPAAFHEDPNLAHTLVAAKDKRLLRAALRSPRGRTIVLHLVRDGLAVPIELTTVSLVRRRRLVAIEGVARLAVVATSQNRAARSQTDDAGPTQQKLAALMVEVHDLLHRMLPLAPGAASDVDDGRALRLGSLTLHLDRLTVTEAGQAVALTTREVLLLRYLMQRTGRVVTRQQLLADVWDYQFSGDDRTVDVHVSRLRRKLPSLRGRLTAIRHIGYRLEDGNEDRLVANS